jgi:hypothetical protein
MGENLPNVLAVTAASTGRATGTFAHVGSDGTGVVRVSGRFAGANPQGK